MTYVRDFANASLCKNGNQLPFWGLLSPVFVRNPAIRRCGIGPRRLGRKLMNGTVEVCGKMARGKEGKRRDMSISQAFLTPQMAILVKSSGRRNGFQLEPTRPWRGNPPLLRTPWPDLFAFPAPRWCHS
jgi:hypothetical protein